MAEIAMDGLTNFKIVGMSCSVASRTLTDKAGCLSEVISMEVVEKKDGKKDENLVDFEPQSSR